MKKLVLVLALIGAICGTAYADIKLPPMKAGIAYSIMDNKFNHIETLDVAKWKFLALELGYAGDADRTNHKAVAVVSASILKLKDYIELPILDLVEFRPGIYAGLGNIDVGDLNESEFDWGLSCTVLNIKF